MPRPLKVLLVAAATSVTGGGERHVADLAELLPEQGVEVSLLAPPGGDLQALAEYLKLPVRHAQLDRGFSYGRVMAVREAIETFAPDLVHAHGARAAAFARMADPRAAERCVYTIHGIHVNKAGSVPRRLTFVSLERLLKSRTRHFVTVCDSDRAKGERLGILDPDKTTTIYNGVPVPQLPDRAVRRRPGSGGDRLTVLSVGRFHQQKDQETLIRAWMRVAARFPNAVLRLVGTGELEGRLRSVAEECHVTSSVKFTEPTTNLSALYETADLFALSSRWEGLPYVVLEAMSYGLPVVATRVDGIPEAVVSEETGLLVPAGDDRELGIALARLLGSPEESYAMGNAGRHRIQASFTLEQMIANTHEMYRAIH